MSYAYAHVSGSLEPLALSDLLTSWAFDPTLILIGIAAFFYFRGLRAYRHSRNVPYPLWRTASFTLGLVLLGLALCSPIDALAEYLFAAHMVQHLIVTVLVAPLILLGWPLFPLIKGAPRWLKNSVVIPLAKLTGYRLVWRFLVHPVSAFLIYSFFLWAWHYPYLYDLALKNEVWHYVEHTCFFWGAIFFWWNIINPASLKPRLPEHLKLAYLFVLAIENAAMSAILTFVDRVLYAYDERPLIWPNLTHLDDQKLGGLIMWVPGDLVTFLAFTLVFATMVKKHTQTHPSYPRSVPVPSA